MMNKIWVLLIFIGVCSSILMGNFTNMGNIMLESTKDAFQVFLNLALLTCFFSGIFNIGVESGLIDILTCTFEKPLRFIFDANLTAEELRKVTANFSANFLGISQAATPLGLEAIAEMNRNNVHKDIASRNEIILVLINASAPSIIPTTIYGLRALAKAKTPLILTFLMIFLSFFSCFVAICLERLFYKKSLRKGAKK